MYTDRVIAYSRRRDAFGPLEAATHKGVAGSPGDGSYLILWLEIAGERIVRAACSTIGCPAAMACGSWTAEWLTGRSVAEAMELTEEAILRALGGVPEGKEYAPKLAIEALRQAMEGGAEP